MQRRSLTTSSLWTLMALLTVFLIFLVFRKEVRLVEENERGRDRPGKAIDCGRQLDKSFRDFVGNGDPVDDRGSAGECASTPAALSF